MDSKFPIIALSGRSRSGKTTIANYLKQYYNAQEYQIAHGLKQIISAVTGVNSSQVDGRDEHYDRELARVDLNGRSMRQVLQATGTFFRELLGDQIFVKDVLAKIELNRAASVRYGIIQVVSDARYAEEQLALIAAGAVIIIIERPTLDADDTHHSETSYRQLAMYEPDLINNKIFFIENDAGLPELYEAVDKLMRTIKRRIDKMT
jgi:dephospho-CoA kinase